MILLAATLLLTSTAQIGIFEVSRIGSDVEIRQGNHRYLFGSGALTTLPITSLDGRLLILGHNEQITCFDWSCREKWSISGLDYITSPQGLVAGKSCFVYYNGPLALSNYPNQLAYLEASRKLEMIEARSYGGKLLWRRPWLDVGSPVAYYPGDSFITVRASRLGLTNIVFRIVDGAGSRRRGWVISSGLADRQAVFDAVNVALTNSDTVWKTASVTKKQVVYELSQVRSSLKLDLGPVPLGFKATVSVTNDNVTVKVLRPVAGTLFARPLQVSK